MPFKSSPAGCSKRFKDLSDENKCTKMMPLIKNRGKLGTSNDKNDALSILEAGLRGSLPTCKLERIFNKTRIRVGKKTISLTKHPSINVVAVGKSADLMAKVLSSRISVSKGIVVVPAGMVPVYSSRKFQIIGAGHPIPTKKSVSAANRIVEFLKSMKPSDLVIFLVSGGASSLVCLPDGISLHDKQVTTRLLVKSGAAIGEINCVRKHLSRVKGGRILEGLKCDALAFVISDVVGDDLSVIASGITFCDKSTYSEARRILLKYHLESKIPKSVWNRIDLGVAGRLRETPKKPLVENFVILSNKDAVAAMHAQAHKLGYRTKTALSISGNLNHASAMITKNLPLDKKSCIIFGGEPTVKVRGGGLGGRNQELVLRLLKKLKKSRDNVVVASLGTDGIDGNSPAAGAIIRSDEWSDTIEEYLGRNDSFSYLKSTGSAIFTGHTHTNVMDIGLVLRK